MMNTDNFNRNLLSGAGAKRKIAVERTCAQNAVYEADSRKYFCSSKFKLELYD
jgi:hypothetical protein